MGKGCYNEEDDQVLKLRKWTNNAFTFLANTIWNKGDYMEDTINGFRGITKQAWEEIALDGSGYTIEYQSSIRSFKKGLKIAEFPTHEYARIDGAKGSPAIPTGLAFVKLFLKELF